MSRVRTTNNLWPLALTGNSRGTLRLTNIYSKLINNIILLFLNFYLLTDVSLVFIIGKRSTLFVQKKSL